MTTFRKARYPKTCACGRPADFGRSRCLRCHRKVQLERDIQARKERKH